MKIYRGASEIYDLVTDERTILKRALMGEDKITMNVTVPGILDLQVGDYTTFQGREYTLNRPAVWSFVNEQDRRYTAEFEGSIYRLLDKQIMLNGKGQFTLVGTLEDFVDLIVSNINTIDSGWTKGTVYATGRKTLTYNSQSCREVLTDLATKFSAEFDVDGKTINFPERVETATALSFERGKGKGLYQLKRSNVDDSNTVTRVYGFGSSRNLDYSYRNGENQLVFENPDTTRYLQNTSEYSRIVEKIVTFEDIYPHFEGSVSGVSVDHLSFSCPAIDFDLNSYLLSGVTAKVVFLTGDLMNIPLEISMYNDSTKTITVKSVIQEGDVVMPGAVFYPQIGDIFTLIDIKMPQAYIDAAELDLKNTTQKWLDIYSQLRVKYGLELDPRYLRNNAITLDIGHVVGVIDTPAGVNKQIRIVGIELPVNSEYQVKAEISNYKEEIWQKEISTRLKDTLQVATDAKTSTTNPTTRILHFWYDPDNSMLKADVDMDITGNLFVHGRIEADEDVWAYVAGAVSSDIFAALTVNYPLNKPSSSVIELLIGAGLIINPTTHALELDGGAVDLTNYYTKTDMQTSGSAVVHMDNVSGLNTALAGKEPLITKSTGYAYYNGTAWSFKNETYEPAFSKNSAFNKAFGTTAGTVSEGNHNHDGVYLALGGTALTASKWLTARTITLIGDASGSTSIDGSANVNITVVVANDSHTHDTRYYTETESDARFLGISANAVSASKWATARTITLGGDLTGNVVMDGSANVTLSAQVVDDSHIHDGRYYTEAETDAKYLTTTGLTSSFSHASNLAVGWYTIAVNLGDRAIGRFAVRDTSSGNHQTLVFYASHHFGAGTALTLLHHSYYGGTPVRYIRIKKGGTYDGAMLQIYIDGATNTLTVALLGDNMTLSGWNLRDFIPDATDPGGVSNFASLVTTGAQIDLDQAVNGGTVVGGKLYAGGTVTQYEVYHAGNFNNAATSFSANNITAAGWISEGGTLLSSKYLGINANAVSSSAWNAVRTITLGGDATGNISFSGPGAGTLTVSVVDDSHNHSVIGSKGDLAAETLRAVHATGIYTYNVNNSTLGDSTPAAYWSVLGFGQGAGGMAEIGVSWTSPASDIWFRSLRDTTDNWWTWKKIFHSGNFNLSTVDLLGNNIGATSNITAGGDITCGVGGALVVAQTAGNDTTTGLSLYSNAANAATYGIQFLSTSNSTYGTHGSVTGDWAMYFNMYNSSTRGWIFRASGSGGVASISVGGVFTIATVTATTVNINGISLTKDASNELHVSAGMFVAGAIDATGEITAFTTATTSDGRLKDEVEVDLLIPLRSGRPIAFHWNELAVEVQGADRSQIHYSFIAQEVNEFMPGAVKLGFSLYYHLAKEEFIAPLVAGWQYHEKKRKKADKERKTLKKQLLDAYSRLQRIEMTLNLI